MGIVCTNFEILYYVNLLGTTFVLLYLTETAVQYKLYYMTYILVHLVAIWGAESF